MMFHKAGFAAPTESLECESAVMGQCITNDEMVREGWRGAGKPGRWRAALPRGREERKSY